MGMCDPSIAPTYCGNPHFSSKPSKTFMSSPEGNWVYLSIIVSTIALHASWIIMQTVEWWTPNKWTTVLHSQGVARHHNVTPTLCSTLIAFLNRVFVQNTSVRTWLHRYRKVYFFVRKFSSQSCSLNVSMMILLHQVELLSLVQTLRGRRGQGNEQLNRRITMIVAIFRLVRRRRTARIAYETPLLHVLLRSSTGSVEVGQVPHGEKLQPFFHTKLIIVLVWSLPHACALY